MRNSIVIRLTLIVCGLGLVGTFVAALAVVAPLPASRQTMGLLPFAAVDVALLAVVMALLRFA